jgi:hypothetical protein
VDVKKQTTVYKLLMALMYSRRFDRLFSEADKDGQFATRPDVARAIIDWADNGEQGFAPEGTSGGSSEDYRYDSTNDRYRAHNAPFDTIEELKMVRGVSDGFMEAFQPHLTVYPSDPNCKVNLSAISNKNGGDCTPLLMGVIRAAAMPVDPTKPPADPGILDDTRLYPIVSVLCDRASAAGFDNLNTITQILQNPQTAVMPDDPRYKIFQGMRPLTMSGADLNSVAKVGSPRIYRVVATGEAGKVKKKITAIIDSAGFVNYPLNSINPTAERAAGVLRYWREE